MKINGAARNLLGAGFKGRAGQQRCNGGQGGGHVFTGLHSEGGLKISLKDNVLKAKGTA